jgi:hypothetical protein
MSDLAWSRTGVLGTTFAFSSRREEVEDKKSSRSDDSENFRDEEIVMKSKRSFNNIIAGAFAFSLLLGSSVQAGNLLGSREDLAPRTAVERSAGLFDQVSVWLLGTWTDLKSVFAETSLTPPPTTQSGCDAGWGLDPEGCPR